MTLGALLGISTVGVGLATVVLRSIRRNREARLQLARSLGFTPIDPTPEFDRRVNELYTRTGAIRSPGASSGRQDRYVLRNVFGRHLDEYEMFLFDLVDRSRENESRTERQSVIVASPRLDLPAFLVFPRVDQEGALAALGNRVIDWAISRWGDPVEFPDAPAFEKRYIVCSTDAEAARGFLDRNRLDRLSETRMLSIHAAGGMFALSPVREAARGSEPDIVAERVRQAEALFSLFRV